MELELVWTIRTANGGATGLEFAQAPVEARHRTVLVHALPTTTDVDVTSNGSRLVAMGRALLATSATPMTRLTIEGLRITRADLWPMESDLGSIVVRHSGGAGELQSWATAEEKRAPRWTWSLQFTGRGDLLEKRARDRSRPPAVIS